MIPLVLQPEPEDFHEVVREPGQDFLRAQGVAVGGVLRPRSRWNGHDYWRPDAIDMLHTAYNDVCCYLCMYLENSPALRRQRRGSSVEHVIPLSQDAWKAYEWNNYALAGQLVNRDRDSNAIVSPFELDFYPFELDLPSGIVSITRGLSPAQIGIALNIIEVLKFDDRPQHEQDRADYYARYSDRTRDDCLTNTEIARYAPFVWHEIQRQNLVINEN